MIRIYPEANLQRRDVQVSFGQQLLEPVVLGIDLLEKPADLLVGEPALAHVGSFLRPTCTIGKC
jgi:hypothetical protein